MLFLVAQQSSTFVGHAEDFGKVINNFWGYVLLLGAIAGIVRYGTRKVTRELDEMIDVKITGRQVELLEKQEESKIELKGYIDEKLKPIEGELKHNGGSSVKDAVRRIEEAQSINADVLNMHIDEDQKVQGLILDSLVRDGRVEAGLAAEARKVEVGKADRARAVEVDKADRYQDV